MISACLSKRPTFLLSIILFSVALVAFPLDAAHAQSQTPGIKTDRAVYAEPPLPALPRAGGKFTDPVFGTEIMRATDEVDCPAPGCGTYYSHWPTFNADNTKLFIRKGETGDAIIKTFDPNTFTLSDGYTALPGSLPGGGGANWESSTWSTTDPNIIYTFPNWYDGGMKLYSYNVSTKTFTLLKDFTAQLAVGVGQDRLGQMYVSADNNTFCWLHHRAGSSEPYGYIVYRLSTDTIMYNDTAAEISPENGINEVHIDKSGTYLAISYNGPHKDGTRYQVLNVNTGVRQIGSWNASDSPTGHGDLGSGIVAGWDSWLGGINMHSLDNIHETKVVYRFQDNNGVTEWRNDLHGTMLADDESWLTFGTYNDPSITGLPDTGVWKDEIMQVKLDGSGQIRRLLHTRSAIDFQTGTTGYWAMPKPTISKNGRFIAYTSNWEKSGRYDLFIAKIDPPNAPPETPPTSPGFVSTAHTTAVTLAGASSVTEAQIRELITSIEQAYNAFTSEANRFASSAQMEMGLRASLYFSRAAAALSVADGTSTGVQNRLQIAASYLSQVQSLMSTNSTASSTLAADTSHAISGGSFAIGPADTRSNASFVSLLAPKSIGVILGDPNQSQLAPQTKSAAMTASGQLPFEVAGVSVTIGGQSAQLLTVSPSRITFYVPEGLPNGEVEVLVTTQEGYVSRGATTIAALAPALFTTSGNGTGAGVAMNAATYARGSFDVTTDLNLSADKRTRLMVFATGISGGASNANAGNDISIDGGKLLNFAETVAVEARAADGRTWRLPVEYAGAEGHLPGLDQVNVILVPELKGVGDVELTVMVGRESSNKVTVNIR